MTYVAWLRPSLGSRLCPPIVYTPRLGRDETIARAVEMEAVVRDKAEQYGGEFVGT